MASTACISIRGSKKGFTQRRRLENFTKSATNALNRRESGCAASATPLRLPFFSAPLREPSYFFTVLGLNAHKSATVQRQHSGVRALQV